MQLLTLLNSGMGELVTPLKDQAGEPMINHHEMAGIYEMIISMIDSIPQYQQEFEHVFGDEKITIDQVTEAIAAFEDTLVTPNSRFDLWLKGDDDAISRYELSGYQIFKKIGCVACHHGETVGGSSYQKIGVLVEYKTDNGSKGREDVTGFF